MEIENSYYERLKDYATNYQQQNPGTDLRTALDVAIEVFENPDKWETLPPVDVATFLDDPYYLNQGSEIWPAVKKEIVDFYQSGCNEAALCEAIGGGKSVSASVITTYEAYKMNCLRDPLKTFKLMRGSKIAFMNMSLTAENARDIVFGYVQSFVDSSPWFQQHAPRDPHINSKIKFLNKPVYILPGNSKQTTPAGYNIFGAVIDESAWFITRKDGNRTISQAEEIHTAMKRRIFSRFKKFGVLVNISSPRYVGDYIEQKVKEAETNPEIFARRAALWEKNPSYAGEATEPVKYNGPEGIEILNVPISLLDDFKKNPEQAGRDLAARPSLALEPYLKDWDAVEAAFNSREVANIWRQGYLLTDGTDRLNGAPAFIHVDLGLTKDRCGIVMVQRRGELYVATMVAQIAGTRSQEVDFSAVRDLIVQLRRKGFRIKKVTYDGWQSKDSEQILKKKGFDVEILSIDRTLGPYDTLKGLIYEGRILLPNFPALKTELQTLELIAGKKVDHPKKGSKDIADALAGACYSAAEFDSPAPASSSPATGRAGPAMRGAQPRITAKAPVKNEDTEVLLKN